VKFLNLNDHIRFTGKLWREEVKTEIDKCHSFVLASQYETFGVVLIESLACGRPVICTDSGGPRDFVHPEHGVIVKNHEAEDLAEGMLHVMNNYNQYDQKQLIAYCKEHFNEHKIAAEIMNLYQSVLSKRVVYS
jgi:glycosyltransferase involved in cell wall biosynthesis